MAVEDLGGREDPPEKVIEDAKKWVDEKAFGTAEYQGVNDYLERERLREHLRLNLEHTLTAKEPEEVARSASNLRITEGQLILLEDRIRERCSQLMGYVTAFVRMESLLSEVDTAYDQKAAAEFPDEKAKQTAVAEGDYTDFMYDIQDVVYKKRTKLPSTDK
jgi:hypothetical protein